MHLADLAKGCFEVPSRLRDLEIKGLASDSREVKPGYLFVAISGPRADGHLFLKDAQDAGAVAAVGQNGGPRSPRGEEPAAARLRIPFFKVKDSRRAVGFLAQSFFGDPTRPIQTVGITGTKGKTTTAWVLHSIFKGAGKISALLGTVVNSVGDKTTPSSNTTPGCLDLHRVLHDLADQGGTHAVLEVSSHGIDQRRTAGVDFNCGVFTNIAPEHLDYHKTFDRYLETKASFFADLSPEAFAVLPREEAASQVIASRTRALVHWYSAESQDGVENVRMGPDGTSFWWKGVRVESSLWGYHNLLNLLAAMTAAECLGFSRQEIVSGIQAASAPPGRLERVKHGRPFRVYVDYAHTDGSLEAVLKALRGITRGRIITVFGCGGDRDKAKRPRMGRVAERLSDNIVITSDNPRSEDPMSILRDIKEGLVHPDEVVLEPDRREAIALGIRMARAGDSVLIAGKGHETYQEFKDRKIHFDDREVAREFLAEGT
jgi:UDP-N-acetylmuramoyl-L-alanyl-D-glutamate--2,6-diaminopimelate ligase